MKMCSPTNKPKSGEIIKVDGKKYEVIKRITDTQYIPHIEKVYKPGETIIKDTTIYVSVPQDVDTTLILQDFYNKVVYLDTLHLKDNLGFISIIDTIQRNTISGRNWYAKVNEKIIKDSIIVKELPRGQVYVGGNIGYDKIYGFNYIGGTAIYKDKRDRMYSLGIGTNSVTKSTMGQVGLYIKIRVKKD
jgi:hypothetical protein